MNSHHSRPCYHCNKNQAKAFSNFCEQCIASKGPLTFRHLEKRVPPWTPLLWLGAIGTTVWLIFKTIAVWMLPLLLLTLPIHAYEPPIKGNVVAVVEQPFFGGLVVDYLTGRKLKAGQRIAVEWGSGSYSTQVLAVTRNIIATDYSPTSVEVEIGATVKILK